MKFSKTLITTAILGFSLASFHYTAWADTPDQQFQQGFEAIKRDDYQTAFKLWLPLAEQGYSSAQYNLGVMYQYGRGVKQDDFEGVKCMKYSKQREALLTLLRSTRSHPSADWLYENLRKEFPNISLGTVYRNLAQLAENGDILKISTSANKEHFDGFVHRHFHFVCNKCDKIYDVDLDGMDEIKNQAAEKLNADIEDYSLIFYGICENCSSKKNN